VRKKLKGVKSTAKANTTLRKGYSRIIMGAGEKSQWKVENGKARRRKRTRMHFQGKTGPCGGQALSCKNLHARRGESRGEEARKDYLQRKGQEVAYKSTRVGDWIDTSKGSNTTGQQRLGLAKGKGLCRLGRGPRIRRFFEEEKVAVKIISQGVKRGRGDADGEKKARIKKKDVVTQEARHLEAIRRKPAAGSKVGKRKMVVRTREGKCKKWVDVKIKLGVDTWQNLKEWALSRRKRGTSKEKELTKRR